jgi:hypothetical protein
MARKRFDWKKNNGPILRQIYKESWQTFA